MPYSLTSLDQARPRRTMARNSTSTVTTPTMTRMSSAPAMASAPRTQPNPASNLRKGGGLPVEQFLQLCAVLRAALNDARPDRVVGLLEVRFALRALQLERLDARRLLLAKVLRDHLGVLGVELLHPDGLLLQ